MSTAAQYIGPYRLLGLIQTGAACQVWEAYDAAYSRRVAIKLLMERHKRDRTLIGELRKEFEVGKQLDHPRVIKQFELNTSGAEIYLVMELFSAPNMKQLLQLPGDKNLSAMEPVHQKIAEQCAEGLAYFHEKGFVHRDVKPHNFLVNREGDVKLIDFSLAVKPAGVLGRMFSFGGSKIQGTRSYMSPEQILKKQLSFESDVYSFGCTIYEMFYGKPAYTGVSANELLTKHLRAAPPTLEAANSKVTKEFSDFLRRCMAKKPKDRPRTMKEVWEELRAIKVYKSATGARK